MSFISDHQIGLILTSFFLGTAGAVLLYRRPDHRRAFKIADLIWVLLGGLGAVAALLAGLYRTDSTRLDRQIDVTYATTRGFERDAARFRLEHCETDRHGPLRPAVLTLCEKVEFLSASTSENRDLPLFLEVTGMTGAPRALRLFSDEASAEEHDRMVVEAREFDPARFLIFAAMDPATKAASDTLAASDEFAGIPAAFQVIATSYQELIEEVRRLKSEWEILQGQSTVLVLQIIALCLIAIAAPFRVGKSVADLNGG